MTDKGDRTLCDILENMRKCHDSRNFSYLPGLIEEAQYRAQRMESAIYVAGGFAHLEERRVKLKDEIRELTAKKTKNTEGGRDG